MYSPFRMKGLGWIDLNVPAGVVVKSNDPGTKFFEITGYTHTQLMDIWENHHNIPIKGWTSSCLNFVMHYLDYMKLPRELVATFDTVKIKDFLKTKYKDYAWRDPSEALWPSPGDICIWPGQHVGISLDVFYNEYFIDQIIEGGDVDEAIIAWRTVEGGQCTPPKWLPMAYDEKRQRNWQKVDRINCFDSVKRKTYPDDSAAPQLAKFTRKTLQGWIDIDRFFYASADGAPDLKTNAEVEARNRHWLNREGQVADPNSPDGSWGNGYFSTNGILPEDPFNRGRLPHPRSPEGRLVDPLKIMRFRKDYDMS